MHRNHVLKELEQQLSMARRQRFKGLGLETFQDKVAMARSMLTDRLIELEHEDQVKRFVQYQQRTLVRLMDHLIADEDKNKRMRPYQEGLKALLVFLQDCFPSYFDQDANVPEVLLVYHQSTMRPQLETLRTLLEREQADGRLAEIILKPVLQVTENLTTSYRMLGYAQDIIQEVINFRGNSAQMDETLRSVLCYLNYNSHAVISYFGDYFSGIIQRMESRSGKAERIAFLLKKVNQMPTKPGMTFCPEAPSLQDYLAGYLHEEMRYLEKEHAPFPGMVLREEVSPGFKLKMEISVAQVAYMLRVFLEMKVVQNENLTELLRFVTGFVTTKKAEHISFESVRVKFYAVESGTRATVRELFMKMVRHIDKS